MDERVTRAWNIWVPPAFRAAHGEHIKKPVLVEISKCHFSYVAMKVKKISLEGHARLTLQAPSGNAGRIPAVVAVLVSRWCSNDLEHFDLNWHIVEDANVTEEERYEFSGRRIVPTEDAVRGGDDSSGAPWHASEVDSTSTASTARAVRAEEGEARALAALHAERAAREAERAAREVERAAREAAEANVARRRCSPRQGHVRRRPGRGRSLLQLRHRGKQRGGWKTLTAD
jgi:hypothetical protein